jgi:hypothetical protein
MRAMALPAFGKMVGHSLKSELVVSTRLRFSYRRVTTWKRRSAAEHSRQKRGPAGRRPTQAAPGREGMARWPGGWLRPDCLSCYGLPPRRGSP